jgi:hypothetical protein
VRCAVMVRFADPKAIDGGIAPLEGRSGQAPQLGYIGTSFARGGACIPFVFNGPAMVRGQGAWVQADWSASRQTVQRAQRRIAPTGLCLPAMVT